MANQFLKVGVITQTMISLLFRELKLWRTVWTDAVNPDEFVNALNDTVTLRVPARAVAHTRTLRSGGPITLDELNEYPVAVKLDTDVYSAKKVTDEEFTLDIVNFGKQVLLPQVRAVAEGVENKLAAEIAGASYADDLPIDRSDPYLAAVAARKYLNDRNVPSSQRTLLVGSGVEAAMLEASRFVKFTDSPGGPAAQDASTEGTIGRIAGFTVVESNAVDEDEAYAYHKTAFVAAGRTPKVPLGATMGETVSLGTAEQQQAGASMAGLSARWIADYDPINLLDRSIVNTWVGTAAVEDPTDPTDPNSGFTLERAVKLHLEGIGS